jgi:hypothetical protein
MAALHFEGQKIPESQTDHKGTVEDQLTKQQQVDLTDPETQARYLTEFNEQMRRLFCPGCGEG